MIKGIEAYLIKISGAVDKGVVGEGDGARNARYDISKVFGEESRRLKFNI